MPNRGNVYSLVTKRQLSCKDIAEQKVKSRFEVRLDNDLFKRVKRLALELDTDLTKLQVAMLHDFFRKTEEEQRRILKWGMKNIVDRRKRPK